MIKAVIYWKQNKRKVFLASLHILLIHNIFKTTRNEVIINNCLEYLADVIRILGQNILFSELTQRARKTCLKLFDKPQKQCNKGRNNIVRYSHGFRILSCDHLNTFRHKPELAFIILQCAVLLTGNILIKCV